MKLEKIFLKSNSRFSQYLANWANEKNYPIDEYIERNDDADEGIDGLVIFTEDQEVNRETGDIRVLFDSRQKPIHKIDINGTLSAGISNLDLWLERNRCKKVLFVGSDALLENLNLERYLINIK